MFDVLLRGLTDLADAALDERIRTIELERRRLDTELAAAIAVAEHRQLPAVDGHRSTNAYLRATLNCSTAEAGRLRSLARAVDHIDGLGESWFAGHFGSSQAARFAVLYGNRRVRDQIGEFAPILLQHAEQLSFADFTVCVERFVAGADPDGTHDDRDDAIEHRNAHVGDLGGMVDITAHGGDGLTAAELIAIHQRFAEAEYRADVDARRAQYGDEADQHPLARTAAQHRFDALVTIFRLAGSADGLGSTADPLVNVVIDADTWAQLLADSGLAANISLDGQHLDPFTGLARPNDLLDELTESRQQLHDHRCETTNGVTLHPHDVLRAALAGHIRRVVVDTAGVVVDLGRRQRLFTGAAREAAKLLILRCEHPGCELPTDFCDVDHATEWADGGPTDQANSRIRCGSHNADKFRHRWRSRRATNNRTYTIRNDGTIMLPVGVRPPTFPTEDDDHDIEYLTQLARARAAALTPA